MTAAVVSLRLTHLLATIFIAAHLLLLLPVALVSAAAGMGWLAGFCAVEWVVCAGWVIGTGTGEDA